MTQRSRSVRRVLTISALLATASLPAIAAPSPVVWSAARNASVSGGSVTKTSGCSGCPDSGAVSQQQFTSGSASFTVSPGYFLLAGLGQSTSGSLGYAINYAFRFSGGSSWEIRESGTYRTEGTYSSSDTFTVTVSGATVTYFRNGSLVYTSKVAAGGALVADVALVTTGASVTATVDGAATTPTVTTTGNSVVWTAARNASVSGGSVTKTSGCSGCPDSGAVSQQQFTSGSASFTVSSGYSLLAGLGQSTSGSLGYAINYAFKFSGGSSWEIRESGTYRTEGTYSSSDTFTVTVSGATVTYFRNGSLVYTSKVAAGGALVADVALVTTGASVTATVAGAATTPTVTSTGNGVVWTLLTKSTASGSSLQKTSGCDGCPDSGAVSEQQFTSGSASFTVALGDQLLAGLGRDTQPGYSIDYAFSFPSWNSWEIREAGVYRADGFYAASDVFKVASDGSTVRYYRNGSLVYTSNVPVPGALRVDATLISMSANVQATTDAVTTAPAPAPTPTPAPTPWGSNLRILQWNIHHGGYGTDGVYSTDRIATWVARMAPDVVMFNEIEKYTSWGNQDQPEVYKNLLQAKTGKTWYYHFAQEYGNWYANGKGSLILSTYPILYTDRYELLNNYDRCIAEVEIMVNNRYISLMLAHLDPYDQGLRLLQAGEVVTWATSKPENRIITGDMNAWPDQGSIAKFNQFYYDSWTVAANNGTATAFPGNTGETKSGRIDYIFYSKYSANITVKSSQVYDTRDSNGFMPSDHRPVLTTFFVQ